MSKFRVAVKDPQVGVRYTVVHRAEDGSLRSDCLERDVDVLLTTASVIVTRDVEYPEWQPCFQVTQNGLKYIPDPFDEVGPDPDDAETFVAFVLAQPRPRHRPKKPFKVSR
jgi:hypothetical protein